MRPDAILGALAEATPDHPARRVLIGWNWTFVEGPSGCGLAHTPSRGTPGCAPPPEAGDLAGRPLSALARLAGDPNPLAAAIGLAAINAARARPDREGAPLNGLDVFRPIADRTVVFGRFPDLDRRLPGARIVERDPRPGEVPFEDAPAVVAAAEAVVLTAQSLVNGTFAHVMAMAAGRRVALVGPGTPLDPLLHAAGVEVVAGIVVTDPDEAARRIGEGANVRGLRGCTRALTLIRPA
jgi:hypothetical protein